MVEVRTPATVMPIISAISAAFRPVARNSTIRRCFSGSFATARRTVSRSSDATAASSGDVARSTNHGCTDGVSRSSEGRCLRALSMTTLRAIIISHERKVVCSPRMAGLYFGNAAMTLMKTWLVASAARSSLPSRLTA